MQARAWIKTSRVLPDGGCWLLTGVLHKATQATQPNDTPLQQGFANHDNQDHQVANENQSKTLATYWTFLPRLWQFYTKRTLGWITAG